MPQSHAQVWLHIVFSTKDRRGFLRKESFRDQMFRMLAHHIKECGCVSASVGGHVDRIETEMRRLAPHRYSGPYAGNDRVDPKNGPSAAKAI